MAIFLSILRGINVSGQKKVLMKDLKSLYEGLGLTDVLTYIQSGNVIFSSKLAKQEELKESIQSAIVKHYSFQVPVEVLSSDELKEVMDNFPFKPVNLEKEGTTFLITFLSQEVSPERVLDLQAYVKEPEKLVLEGKVVYLHCPNGYGRSKLSNTFIEKKLKVSATTRNWKTVNKLYDLLNA